MAFYVGRFFITKVRQANNGADEHEEYGEFGVHLIIPSITQVTLLFLLLFYLSTVIDEDQKSVGPVTR
jgi:hypothetical protein